MAGSAQNAQRNRQPLIEGGVAHAKAKNGDVLSVLNHVCLADGQRFRMLLDLRQQPRDFVPVRQIPRLHAKSGEMVAQLGKFFRIGLVVHA